MVLGDRHLTCAWARKTKRSIVFTTEAIARIAFFNKAYVIIICSIPVIIACFVFAYDLNTARHDGSSLQTTLTGNNYIDTSTT